jgi:uncharacterized protein YbjT (DUF2867 family)
MKIHSSLPHVFSVKSETIARGPALVVGATGTIGGYVLSGLVEHGIPVRAGVRDPAKVVFPEQVEVVPMDLSQPETFQPALQGIEKVFLYAHAATAEEFAKVAEGTGVKHIVLLSSQAAESERWEEGFNSRRHREAELPLECSGLGWTFLRPGSFDSNTLSYWAKPIQDERLVRMAYPEAQMAPIHERDIAEVGVRALLDMSLNQTALRLTGPESLTQRKMVKCIAEAISAEVRIKELTHAEARKMFSSFMPVEYADITLNALKKNDGIPDLVTDTVERILGRPARTFSQWSKENARSFA